MSERANITLETVRKLPAESIVWDAKVRGFGARRQKGDAIAYVLFYRTKDGRQRWQTIGKHGSPWTPDLARAEARRILGEVVGGGDPAGEKAEARKAATVAELCDSYLEAASAGRILTRGRAKKASTLLVDKSNITNHVKPLLGGLKVGAVTRRDIERFQDAVTAGETAAASCGPGRRPSDRRARRRNPHHGIARRRLSVRRQAQHAGRQSCSRRRAPC